jgi:hypothetical protein
MGLVASAERISEAYMLAMIALLKGFPFEVRRFHSDRGFEYVNRDRSCQIRAGSSLIGGRTTTTGANAFPLLCSVH